MNVQDLIALHREGALLCEHENQVRSLASEASLSANEYEAPDARHALAWLLWNRHQYSCTYEPREEINLPIFRGQRAEYTRVQSGTSREGTEAPFTAKIDWFGVLLCAWLEVAITPPKGRDGGPATFALSREERLYLAQHYFDVLNVRTPLLDWTFDPLVAFVFAARCKRGRVLIHTRGLNDKSYLVLPPLSVTRPWIQKAVHGWNTDFPVTALQSVVFSANEEERQAIEDIYKSLFPMDSITELARIAIRQGGATCPRSLVAFPTFANLKSFDPATSQELERLSPQPVSNDLFFEYIDSICLKRLGAERMYDILPLCAVLHNSFWAGDLLGDDRGSKSRIIEQIWSDPDFSWGILRSIGRYKQI